MKYRSMSTFVAFDLLLIELYSFLKTKFSRLLYAVFCDIDLKFVVWIYLDIIQIKFDFWRLMAYKLFSFVTI